MADKQKWQCLFFNTTDVWIDDNNSARVGSQNVRVQNNIFVQAANQNLAMVRDAGKRFGWRNGNVNRQQYLFRPERRAVFLDDNLDWEEWTLTQWSTQTARDIHSKEANPNLNSSQHLSATSPCINAGINLPAVTHDIDGHRAATAPMMSVLMNMARSQMCREEFKMTISQYNYIPQITQIFPQIPQKICVICAFNLRNLREICLTGNFQGAGLIFYCSFQIFLHQLFVIWLQTGR
jgi:hypothetical protein